MMCSAMNVGFPSLGPIFEAGRAVASPRQHERCPRTFPPWVSAATRLGKRGTLALTERRRGGGRPAVTGCLLVRVRETYQRWLRPCATEERDPRRQQAAAGVSHGNLDRREAGRRREELAVVAVRRVEIADEPRRVAPRRVH